MLLATIRMVVPPDKRAEAVQILNAMAERTRVEPGCLSCRIYHDEQVEATAKEIADVLRKRFQEQGWVY